MISAEKSKILNEFLSNWPIERIRVMTYEEYSGLEDANTFCYSVEHGTLKLGTIRGYPSSKFGFFRWGRSFNQQSERSIHDSKYAWDKKLGSSRKAAFFNLIEKVCEIIDAAKTCDLEAIESITLNSWYKWKLASLYSEGRIPPIFKMDVIKNIANEYGIKINKNDRVPVLNFIMNGIPESECRFEFVFNLFKAFDYDSFMSGSDDRYKNEDTKLIFRKKASYTSEMRHNIIQNNLFRWLKYEYPNDNIKIENNYIDIFRENSESIYFYEVKSSYSPTYCVREALGQALHYAHKFNSLKKKNIVVVGEREPSNYDNSYFKFIKENIKIKFEYLNISID